MLRTQLPFWLLGVEVRFEWFATNAEGYVST